MTALMRSVVLLLLVLASHSAAAQRDDKQQRERSRNRPPAQPCPTQASGLIRKASANAKIMSDIDKTCARDSRCYSKCFCSSIRTSVAVARQANVDRKHPAWSSCMKEAWQVMVKPRVPKKALEAWTQKSCAKEQTCSDRTPKQAQETGSKTAKPKLA